MLCSLIERTVFLEANHNISSSKAFLTFPYSSWAPLLLPISQSVGAKLQAEVTEEYNKDSEPAASCPASQGADSWAPTPSFVTSKPGGEVWSGSQAGPLLPGEQVISQGQEIS